MKSYGESMSMSKLSRGRRGKISGVVVGSGIIRPQENAEFENK